MCPTRIAEKYSCFGRSRALTDRDVKAARDVTHGDVTHTVALPAALTAPACRRPGTQRPLCSSESRAPPADAAALTDGDVDTATRMARDVHGHPQA